MKNLSVLVRKNLFDLIFITAVLFGAFFVLKSPNFIETARAATVTWNGGGADETCGGQAGSGNWWSCGFNWSSSSEPGINDDVVFDSTSTKSATIDSAFGGSIKSLSIKYGYTGTITQSRDLAITEDFDQRNGAFNSSPSYAFSVGGSFFTAQNRVSNGTVYSIRGDGNGVIYIGGNFTAIDNLPIKYLAKFDGNGWSSLGDNPDSPVSAITIDSNNNVYVGGTFKKIGNLTVNGIAKWDGNSWSALDGGVYDGYDAGKIAGEVNALEVDDANRIYVGGTFEHAGTLDNVNHIARWNGAAWEKFGNGVGTSVYDGGGGNNYLKGNVSEIIVKDNPDGGATDKDIYFAGSFTYICGNATCTSGNTIIYNIAKYDGLSLTIGVLNSGVTATVNAMGFDASGNLAVATAGSGAIHQTSDNATCSIGWWDGSSWVCRNSFNGTPYDFELVGDQLYTGGSYNWPGQNLANWTEALKNSPPTYNYYGTNVPLGYGVNGSVYDVEGINGTVYIVGVFDSKYTNSNSTTSSFTSNVVKYDSAVVDRAQRITPAFTSASFTRYTGSGTSDSPYVVSDVYGLQAINLSPASYFTLSGDIDASSTSDWNNGSGFLPISSTLTTFTGNLNGDSHSISGLTMANFDTNAGLFGVIGKTGQVSNLTISDASMTSTTFIARAGILAGKNMGLISDINVSGTMNISSSSSVQGYSVGGAVGYSTNINYGTGDVPITSLDTVTTDVAITGSYINEVGGVLGTQEKIAIKMAGSLYYTVSSTIIMTLTDLSSSGAINITNTLGKIGGVIGSQNYQNATLTNSDSSSAITTTVDNGTGMTDYGTEYIGGLVGYSFGTISDSNTTGTITATISVNDVDLNSIGGLVGKIETTTNNELFLTNTNSTGNITITQANGLVSSIGGLSGDVESGLFDTNYSTGAITIDSTGEVKFIGGLIGSDDRADITNSYSTGAIDIDNHNATSQLATGSTGGLVGIVSQANVSDTYSTSSVTVSSDASCEDVGGIGGLIGIYSGISDVSITKSNATGNVTANCGKVGGLAGWSTYIADQVFATGNVSGSKYAGGLVGYVSGWVGSLSNSFSTGNVTGSDYKGGLIGFGKDSNISNSYSLGSVSGDGHKGGLVSAWDSRNSNLIKNFYLQNGGVNNLLPDISQEMVDGETGNSTNDNIDSANIGSSSKESLMNSETFSDWDLATIWGMNSGYNYPYLRQYSSFAPEVSTSSASINGTTAALSGSIDQVNTFNPYARGFAYGTDINNPTIVEENADSNDWNGNYSAGDFSLNVTNLSAGTYQFRTFASSIGGTDFGEWQEFTVTAQNPEEPDGNQNVTHGSGQKQQEESQDQENNSSTEDFLTENESEAQTQNNQPQSTQISDSTEDQTEKKITQANPSVKKPTGNDQIANQELKNRSNKKTTIIIIALIWSFATSTVIYLLLKR